LKRKLLNSENFLLPQTRQEYHFFILYFFK
jgi:hypothetical protein